MFSILSMFSNKVVYVAQVLGPRSWGQGPRTQGPGAQWPEAPGPRAGGRTGGRMCGRAAEDDKLLDIFFRISRWKSQFSTFFTSFLSYERGFLTAQNSSLDLEI